MSTIPAQLPSGTRAIVLNVTPSLKKKGTSAYYWPSDGRLYCKSCGESEYRQLFSAVADEEVYQSIEKLTSFVNFLLFIQPFIPWFINICRAML